MSTLDDIHRHLQQTRDSQARATARRDREDAALAHLARRLDALENDETHDTPTLADLANTPCPDHLPETA